MVGNQFLLSKAPDCIAVATVHGTWALDGYVQMFMLCWYFGSKQTVDIFLADKHHGTLAESVFPRQVVLI